MNLKKFKIITMKKIILITIILLLAFSFNSFAQVKAHFSLQNPRIESGYFVIDLYVNVPSGQTWGPGPTNIRVDYWTTDPPNGISLVEESPASNANTNLNNNVNYGYLTTTNILNGTACSMNILLLYNKTPYQLNPGNHWIASFKFNLLNPSACIMMAFRTNSAVFDNLNPLSYGTQWTKTDPPPCILNEIGNSTNEIPSDYVLHQNYPNPFNPVTKISFDLPKSEFVTLKVYNILGNEVATLVNEFKHAGKYIIEFNASELSSGIYYYRLETSNFVDVKKMVLIK